MSDEPEYPLYQHPIEGMIVDYIDNVIVPMLLPDDFIYMKEAVDQYGIETSALMMHHGLGRWIRNTFKLWECHESEIEIYMKQLGGEGCHPDDLSNLIIKHILENRLND